MSVSYEWNKIQNSNLKVHNFTFVQEAWIGKHLQSTMVLGCLFSESLQKTYHSSVCLSVCPSIHLPFILHVWVCTKCMSGTHGSQKCVLLSRNWSLGSRGYQTQVLLDTGQCWSILFWTYILFKNLFWEAIPFQHAMQLLINPTAGHAWFLCVLTQKHGFLPFCFSPTGNRICLCRSACPQTQRLFCLSPAVFFQF